MICHKKGCWSSRHCRKECDESNNRFKEQLGQQFDRKVIAQYITNFEETESSQDYNLNDENLEEIEALVVDVSSSLSILFDDENSETFFASLGLEEKAQKMATTLADKSFSHSLSTIGNILPNLMNFVNATCKTIDSDLFPYIVTDRYSSDKFYGITIDTSVSKHFIVGHG